MKGIPQVIDALNRALTVECRRAVGGELLQWQADRARQVTFVVLVLG